MTKEENRGAFVPSLLTRGTMSAILPSKDTKYRMQTENRTKNCHQ